MIGQWKDRWDALSLRERWLVGAMLALLAIVVLWLGIIRPVQGGLTSAEAELGAATERYAVIRARVDAIKRLSGNRPGALGAPLDMVISQSAGETGFTLDRNDPQGDGRVSIAIGSARPAAFFGWLADLEARGVQVETLNARPAPGGNVISVTAVLRTAG